MTSSRDDAAVRGYLVVTRRVGESVWIGDGIEVRVDAIEATRARLLVVAPRNVPVRRTAKPLEEK